MLSSATLTRVTADRNPFNATLILHTHLAPLSWDPALAAQGEAERGNHRPVRSDHRLIGSEHCLMGDEPRLSGCKGLIPFAPAAYTHGHK
jgi:hypothetical protein